MNTPMRSATVALVALLMGCGPKSQPASTAPATTQTDGSSVDASGTNAPGARLAPTALAPTSVTARHIIMEGEAPDDGPGYFLMVSDEDVDECKLSNGILFGLAAHEVETHSQAITIGQTDDVGEAFVCLAAGQGDKNCVNGEGTVEVDNFVRGVGARGRYKLSTPNGMVSGTFDATWRDCR